MAKRIDAALPGNKIQFTRDLFTSLEKNIPYLGVFLRILVGLAAVVSALVVMLAMYTTITERTREIGILKALGASRRYIVFIIESEALLISAGGFGRRVYPLVCDRLRNSSDSMDSFLNLAGAGD